MKQILIPIIAGILIGCLVGGAILYYEFGSVEESFINYLPE